MNFLTKLQVLMTFTILIINLIKGANISLSAKNWNISMEASFNSILSGLKAIFYSNNNAMDNLNKSDHESNRSSNPFDPLFSYLLSAIEKISNNGCFYKGSICYKNLGCFSTQESASKLTCMLPEFPSLLRNQFILYTRSNNKPISLIYDSDESTAYQAVPKRAKLAFLIHGYSETGSDKDYITIKDRLLKYTAVNAVIIVDGRIALRLGNFLRAIVNTELIGRQVAVLIEKLKIHRNLNCKDVHLIGFSLGVKVSHFACSWGQKTFNNKLGRVTGLDPGDLIGDTDVKTALNPNDANFVDVIHTSALNEEAPASSLQSGGIGLTKPMGHIDFYPNGGHNQPWCSATQLLCNHSAARKLFISSLYECNFISVKCTSFNIWKSNNPCDSTNESIDSSSSLGYHSINKRGTGIHYLKTTDKYPYC